MIDTEYKKIIDGLLSNPEIDESVKQQIQDKIDNASTSGEESFMKHYIQLKDIVAKLKQMREPDVDIIIPLIEKGMIAYKGCEGRISKVEEYLAEME